MKYDRIHINRFGRLQNRTIDFSDGINLICEPDAAEDSPLHAFFESIQFGMDSPSEDPSPSSLYHRFLPETGVSTYGGVLEFTRNDTNYEIYRNFTREPHGYALMDKAARRQLKLSDEQYNELLAGITRPLFHDTLAIRHTDSLSDTADRYRAEIRNLCSTGSPAIDLEEASRRLDADALALKREFSETAQNRAEELNREYRELSAERSRLSHSAELSLWEKERQSIQREIDSLSDRKNALQQAIANEESYLKDHAKTTDRSLQDVESESQRLLARREKLLQQYPEPNSGPFGGLYPLLTAAGVILALVGLFSGIRSVTTQDTLSAVLGFVILAAMIGLLAYSIPRLRAQLAFRYVDRSLAELYQQILPETPEYIDQQSLQQFIQLMEELKDRRKHLQKCRRELESVNGRVFQLQEKQERMMVGMDSKKKDFQRMTQLDERIGQLEAEMDGLSSTLQRNLEIREEMCALEEARETIRELVRTRFRTFRHYLSQFSSQLIQELSEGRWQEIAIDDEGTVTLRQKSGTGTLEDIGVEDLLLIAVSLRIAQIGYIWPQESVPLLLQEQLYRYDSHRVLELLSWLNEYYPGQVFLFTSENKEEEILRKADIPYHVIK